MRWILLVALLSVTPGRSEPRADVVIAPGETLRMSDVAGRVENHGSIVGEAAGLLTFGADTYVKGRGYFANTQFEGVFAPGNSPGVTTGTNQAFSSSSTIEFELGGVLPGFGAGKHDQINDLGTVTLLGAGPTLKILPYDGFMPQPGDEFVVLTWRAGLVGSFGALVAHPSYAASGVMFTPVITNASGVGNLTLVVQPVPELSSALLIGAAGLVIAVRRAMRRSR
jgi:hypothetical protein